MIVHLHRNWPEYLIEGALLGLFMISAAGFGVLSSHPASPLAAAVPDGMLRRALGGLAMGGTAVALIYSPWGKRSGAHMNPATTLTFWRLGRVGTVDALFYAVAQVVGGTAGIGLAAWAFRDLLADEAVRYVVTVPGRWGLLAAFAGEASISFVLMSTILVVSNVRRLNRWTGLCAGVLVATFIAFESPVSGMSMNPARTAASALAAGVWDGFWIYATAPPAAMLAAAMTYLAWRGEARVFCAKLHHDNERRCIFRCRWGETPDAAATSVPVHGR